MQHDKYAVIDIKFVDDEWLNGGQCLLAFSIKN